MGLFTPAWKGKDESKALARIRACKNQKTLKRIALEAPSLDRRIEAVKLLQDPADMVEAVFDRPPKNDLFRNRQDRWNWGDCQAFVVDHIEDKETLRRLAKEGVMAGAAFHLVRKLKKIGRQEKDVALDSGLDLSVRKAAIQCIDSQETLHALAERFIDRGARSLCLDTIRAIRDPEIRKLYCKSYDTHDYVKAEQTSEQYGDTRIVTERYTCKYCGASYMKEEDYKF